MTGGLAIFSAYKASAQAAGPSKDLNPDLNSAIHEIVVTATRRAVDVSTVPYNISVVSGDSLESTGVTNLAQLAQQVPGFDLVDKGARSIGSDIPIIRGLNVTGTAGLLAPYSQLPVGRYLGNSPIAGSFPLDDVQRVEILRGPQGTLYGAGSLGGAVRVIPNDPVLGELAAGVEGSASTFAHSSDAGYSASGLLNMPVSSIAALRISVKHDYAPGFVDQEGIYERQGNSGAGSAPVLADPGDVGGSSAVLYNRSDVNFTQTDSGRVALLLEPQSELKIELAGNFSQVIGNGGPDVNPDYRGGPSLTDPGISLPAGGPYSWVHPSLEPFSRNSELGSLDVSYDMGFATLSSTTTYDGTAGATTTESTPFFLTYPVFISQYYYGSPIDPRFIADSLYTDSTRSWTQELRLVSRPGTVIDYVVGAFYEHEIKSILWDLLTPGTMQQQLAENDGKSIVTTGANGLIFQEPSDQLFMEKAVFGEATWHLTGRWDLIAGARVFHQDFSEIQSYTSYTFFEGQSAASSTEGTNQTFKLNTSYKFADTQLAYATFSQGYRRGGANAVPTSGYLGESPEIEKYSPDKANNYEIGLKGRLDDGLRYSADVFYIQWKDAQIGLSTPVNGWPVVINSAGARSKGVELELSTPIIVPAASMTLGYTYVDATLTKSFCLPAGNGYGGFTPCGISGTAGNQLPGTPKNSASATFNYDQGLGANSRLIYALNASYKGSIYAQLPSIAGIDNNLAGYTLLNGSITFQPGNNIRLSLYGNNLADKRAYYTVPAHDADLLAYAQEFTISTPREIGIRVGYHW
jgi:outer membrane receptor protein involved in Fe transport